MTIDTDKRGHKILEVKDRVRYVRGRGYADGTVTKIEPDRPTGEPYLVYWDDDVESWHSRDDLWWMSGPAVPLDELAGSATGLFSQPPVEPPPPLSSTQWFAWWEGVQAAVNRWHQGRDFIMANPYPRPDGLDDLIPGPLPDREDGYVTRDPEPWLRFDGSRAPHTGVNLGGSGYIFNPRPEYDT